MKRFASRGVRLEARTVPFPDSISIEARNFPTPSVFIARSA